MLTPSETVKRNLPSSIPLLDHPEVVLGTLPAVCVRLIALCPPS